MRDVKLASVNDRLTMRYTYIQFLEDSFLFKGMRSSDLKKVANAFKVVDCDVGETIFEQGATGDAIYIIVDGVVGLVQHDPDKNKETTLRKLARFEVIGENCFVHSTHEFLANVRVIEKVRALCLERPKFEEVKYQRFMFPVSMRIEAARRTLIRDGVRKVPFMRDLQDDDLGAFELDEVDSGYVFCKEGEVGDQFFILLSGQVVVTTTDGDGLHVEISRMSPKPYPISFGEMSLVTDEPRNATITTLKPSTVFSIEKKEFQKILRRNKEVALSIEVTVKKSELGNYFARKVPIFSAMSEINQRLLGVVAFLIQFEKGDVVKTEGTMSVRNFYLIESGSVDILIGGELIRTLTEGDYFGEVGLISNRPSSATVKVTDDGPLHCMAVKNEDFNTILAGETAFLSQMKIRILGQNCSLEDILQHPQGRESFLEFCRAEFARENVDFWQDVMELENLERRTIRKSVLRAMRIDPGAVKARKRQMLEDKIKSIYLKYLQEKAPQWINLPASIRDPLIERINKDNFSYTMFRDAKHSIYTLIEADNFQRYKQSPAFGSLLEDLGVYQRAIVYNDD